MIRSVFYFLEEIYRKVPIISPGLMFVQKAVCWANFQRGLLLGGIFRFKMGWA